MGCGRQRKIKVVLLEAMIEMKRKLAKSLEFYPKQFSDWDEAVAQAYASGGYGMKEIGSHFGLHYSRVSSV